VGTDPYQAPRARLADAEPAERGWLRLKYYHLAILLGVGYFGYLDNQFPYSLRSNYVFALVFLAIAIGCGRRVAGIIWSLDGRRRPPWVRPLALFSLLAMGPLTARLGEAGLPTFRLADLYMPFAVYLLIAIAATVYTEHKKSTRIFIGNHNLIFR